MLYILDVVYRPLLPCVVIMRFPSIAMICSLRNIVRHRLLQARRSATRGAADGARLSIREGDTVPILLCKEGCGGNE